MAQNRLSMLPRELQLEIALLAMGPGRTPEEAAMASSLETYLGKYASEYNNAIFTVPGFADLARACPQTLSVGKPTIFVQWWEITFDQRPEFFDGVANLNETRMCLAFECSGFPTATHWFVVPVINNQIHRRFLPHELRCENAETSFNKLTELTIVGSGSPRILIGALSAFFVIYRPNLRKLRVCSLSNRVELDDRHSLWDLIFTQGFVPQSSAFDLSPGLKRYVHSVVQKGYNLEEARFDMMTGGGEMSTTIRTRNPGSETDWQWQNSRTTWSRFADAPSPILERPATNYTSMLVRVGNVAFPSFALGVAIGLTIDEWTVLHLLYTSALVLLLWVFLFVVDGILILL